MPKLPVHETPFREPEDWVFATNSSRAGKKRGKQPLWLSTVMRYHIEPVVRKLGIKKRVDWHTFRRTYATLLKANGEDVKVVQELLRHGSIRVHFGHLRSSTNAGKTGSATEGGCDCQDADNGA